jgi:hypothetical protein
MNQLIREAITEKLTWLAEEKESLDYTIENYQAKLKEMIATQAEYGKAIAETVQFLKDNKANGKTPKHAPAQSGQKRSRALKGDNSRIGQTSTNTNQKA